MKSCIQGMTEIITAETYSQDNITVKDIPKVILYLTHVDKDICVLRAENIEPRTIDIIYCKKSDIHKYEEEYGCNIVNMRDSCTSSTVSPITFEPSSLPMRYTIDLKKPAVETILHILTCSNAKIILANGVKHSLKSLQYSVESMGIECYDGTKVCNDVRELNICLFEISEDQLINLNNILNEDLQIIEGDSNLTEGCVKICIDMSKYITLPCFEDLWDTTVEGVRVSLLNVLCYQRFIKGYETAEAILSVHDKSTEHRVSGFSSTVKNSCFSLILDTIGISELYRFMMDNRSEITKRTAKILESSEEQKKCYSKIYSSLLELILDNTDWCVDIYSDAFICGMASKLSTGLITSIVRDLSVPYERLELALASIQLLLSKRRVLSNDIYFTELQLPKGSFRFIGGAQI